MATNKLTLIDEKIKDVSKQESVMKTRNVTDKTDPTYISKSTRGTQLYHMKREKQELHLLRTLIEANPNVELKGEDLDVFVLMTTLSSERVTTKYVFNEGDNILEVMDKYPNLNRKSLEEKVAKQGLALDFTSGKIVLA